MVGFGGFYPSTNTCRLSLILKKFRKEKEKIPKKFRKEKEKIPLKYKKNMLYELKFTEFNVNLYFVLM